MFVHSQYTCPHSPQVTSMQNQMQSQMQICVMGNVGVGKSFIKKHLDPALGEIHELTMTRENADVSRAALQSCKEFVAIFVIMTEGGRLQADDAEMLALFSQRKQWLVIVNKSWTDEQLSAKIKGIFRYPGKTLYLPRDVGKTAAEACLKIFVENRPEPYQSFLWPHEELEVLRKQKEEADVKQAEELAKEEVRKQKLLDERKKIEEELEVAKQKLAAQLAAAEQAKRVAAAQQLAITNQIQARVRQDQLEHQRREAAAAAQRAQEEARQRARDDAFRQQIGRLGR